MEPVTPKRLTVILSAAEARVLDEIRSRDGIPVAEQIRRALRAWTQAHGAPAHPLPGTPEPVGASGVGHADLRMLMDDAERIRRRRARVRARLEREAKGPPKPTTRSRVRAAERVAVRDSAAGRAAGEESPGAKWWRERQTVLPAGDGE